MIWVASNSQKYVLTKSVKVFAKPQDKDKNKLPKKNIKKDLFPIATLSSLKISVKVILPVHFDKDFISSLVLYEE